MAEVSQMNIVYSKSLQKMLKCGLDLPGKVAVEYLGIHKPLQSDYYEPN